MNVKLRKFILRMSKIAIYAFFMSCSLSLALATESEVTEQVEDQQTVSGTIADESGDPLPGATIQEKGTANGTITGVDGTYSINVAENATITVSFVGFKTQEVQVNGRSTIDLSMEQDEQALQEVVVTALGISRERRELGYSVQSLDTDDLNATNDFNVVNALSGKLAGVQITNSGSQIGASSRIVVRGNASFAGNQPLFVVDGIPIDNRSTNLGGAGGIDYGNAAADIDPQNIESLTVLKGASATALYGSRAAHGVIMIETKKGTKAKTGIGVDFTTSAIFDDPSYFMNFQNEYGIGNRGSEYDWQEYLANNPGENLTYNEYAQQISYNYVDGTGGGINENANPWGPRFDAGLLLDQWASGPNSPYVSNPDNLRDNFFQTGKNILNQVAVTAKGENAYGRLAFSNRNMDGIFFNTDQRINTLNGSVTLKPSDRLTVGSSFNYINRFSNNLPEVSYGTMTAVAWGPFRNIPLDKVKEVYEEHGNEMGSGYNPNADNYFYNLENSNGLQRDRFFGNVNINYDILDWLSFSSIIGLDHYNEKRDRITKSRTRRNINRNQGGQFSLTTDNVQEFNADARINVKKDLSESFSIEGLVGGNFRQNKLSSVSLGANDLTVPDLFTISNAKGVPNTGMIESQRESLSLYSSATLSYKDYLFLGLTARNDWSSTLPAENWSYFYPSASLSVLLTEALNFESSILSYAQIRGNVAKVGSDTDPYRLNGTYGIGSFNNITLFNPTGVKPPANLRPEETTSFEVGVELGFIEDRFSLDATYYNQTTNDMILQVPVARSTGYSSQLINAAEIENKGVELMLNARIIQGFGEEFSWNASLNWALNRSTVVSLYEGLENLTISSGFGGARLVGTPGSPWGDISGLPFVRNEQGQIIVNDAGLPVTTSEQTILGNVTPDWIGGLSNTFRYKKFQLGALIDVRKGGDFFSCTMWHSYPTGAFMNTVENNVREEGIVFDGVTEDGTPNEVRLSAQTFFTNGWLWNNHEYSIIDASYVKLRELTLSYNFGDLGFLRNVNLSVFGRNLAILHRSKAAKDLGLDPEAASQMGGGELGTGFENFMPPTSRSYGLNLNVSF